MRTDVLTDGARKDQVCPSSFREIKIGRTHYRVICAFTGETDFGSALEKLAVQKILGELKAADGAGYRNA